MEGLETKIMGVEDNINRKLDEVNKEIVKTNNQFEVKKTKLKPWSKIDTKLKKK